jgi:ubiquinone/menaquinone biosynthesis C-methylase UbiE
VMDVGCGMGLFSIAIAKMVGDTGLVIAVDLQQRMLDVLRKRAEKQGVSDRIQTHRCEANRLGVEMPVDFALAMMMVHEVLDQRRLLGEIHGCLKPSGRFLVAEPKIHVPGNAFANTVTLATDLGFKNVEEPRVPGCRAVVFEKVEGLPGPAEFK